MTHAEQSSQGTWHMLGYLMYILKSTVNTIILKKPYKLQAVNDSELRDVIKTLFTNTPNFKWKSFPNITKYARGLVTVLNG